ncbi:MAG TPA: zinc-binding dehydrogenase [Planctomycetota bacterium]|nr:zinc-binding dehydrogenase [Planctomycetota bacterium]
MNAAVIPAVGAPLRVEDIRHPEPKAGEVRIRIAACGVCHSDLHVARGHLKFPMPCVPGHEISGTIDLPGPGVSGFKSGDRVVSSFIMPCGDCPPCRDGRDNLCETYFALNRVKGVLFDGTTRLYRGDGTPLAMQMMGGMAQFAIVPVTDVFPLPGSLPLEESCILGCALMTAYGAVKNSAQIRPGQTVAVIGAGGVGSNVIALARVFGSARVIAVDVREDKLQAARALGATDTLDARTPDLVAQLQAMTQGRGVDVAIEAIGRSETVTQAFNMVCDGGRVVVLGVAPMDAVAPIGITRLVRRGIQIVGSFGCRVRTDMPELIALAASGKIDVKASITRRYRLDQVNEAFEALERGEIVGRSIVVM